MWFKTESLPSDGFGLKAYIPLISNYRNMISYLIVLGLKISLIYLNKQLIKDYLEYLMRKFI